MITTIASLLHMHVIEDVISAKRQIQAGHFLVREDDLKPIVIKLRQEYDALLAERDALKAQVEAARRMCEASYERRPWPGWVDASRLLVAMDEAAK